MKHLDYKRLGIVGAVILAVTALVCVPPLIGRVISDSWKAFNDTSLTGAGLDFANGVAFILMCAIVIMGASIIIGVLMVANRGNKKETSERESGDRLESEIEDKKSDIEDAEEELKDAQEEAAEIREEQVENVKEAQAELDNLKRELAELESRRGQPAPLLDVKPPEPLHLEDIKKETPPSDLKSSILRDV